MTGTTHPRPLAHPGFRGLIGVGREDITPPVGIYCRCWGAASTDVAEGVHRPFTLTALTLRRDADAPPLVLIEMDSIGWGHIGAEQRFRRRLLDRLGLQPGQLVFGVSHAHSTPWLTDRPDPTWAGGELVGPYVEHVFSSAVTSVEHALNTSAPGELVWHTGTCRLATNRDLPDPDADRWVCGYHPDAPADDTLLVGRAATDDGEILCTLVNYACHPTTLAWQNRLASPDFVGMMRETVQRQTGGAPCLFLQGAAGEYAPRHQYVGDTEIADQNGRQIGYAALAVLNDMVRPGHALTYDGVVESGAPLAVWKLQSHDAPTALVGRHCPVTVGLKDWPKLAELEEQYAGETDRALKERLRRKLALRRDLGDDATFPMAAWVWKLGEAFVVAVMAEAYSDLQRRLRAEFPRVPIVCINLINASGYLPPADAYDTDLYQVWQTPYARGGLERVIEQILHHIAPLTVSK